MFPTAARSYQNTIPSTQVCFPLFEETFGTTRYVTKGQRTITYDVIKFIRDKCGEITY